jgi:hypothetical protein
MNENVNISFIPKKPMARDEAMRRHRSLLTVPFFISFVIAMIAVGVSIMQFIRLETVERERVDVIEDLRTYNDELEKNDTLKEIRQNSEFVKRIDLVESLLNKHIASTKLFAFLERTTPKLVSFNNFNYKGSGEDGFINLSMRGEATSYEVLAALSQLYKKENELLKEYKITNFSLTDQGRVSFDFTGKLPLSLISYTDTFDSIKE